MYASNTCSSTAVGELELLPHVREAPKDELIVANGFSCREQTAQTTDREGLHLAQVIQMAMHDGPGGAKGDYPEKHYPKVADRRDSCKTAALLGAAVLVGGSLFLLWKRKGKPLASSPTGPNDSY